MTALPWRILVLTEAGTDAKAAGVGALHAIDAGGVDGWLESLGATVEVALGPGRSTSVLLDRLAAFEPEALAATLAPGGVAPPADLDALLHHPALQRIESAARGIELLLRHAEDVTQVQVLAAPRKEIIRHFRDQVFDPLVDGPPSKWPSLIVLDLDFSHRADDLILLREMASLARVLQAPVVANAAPTFFDFRHLSHVMALPDLASRFMDPSHASWRQFQSSDEARWVALTINRFLQREPYALASPSYNETIDPGQPETYLWGRGVWLVAAAVARSARSFGHAMDLSGRGGLFDGLPARPYPVAANDTALLSTEVPLPDQKALELSRAAFTPVVGKLRANLAVLTSVVTVFRLQPARLTVEGTLSYQLLAGRLAQFCTLLLESLPAGDPAQAVELARAELTAFLGPLAGEVPAEAVAVELKHEEVEGALRPFAEVAVRPVVPIEGKPIDFQFVLPLRG